MCRPVQVVSGKIGGKKKSGRRGFVLLRKYQKVAAADFYEIKWRVDLGSVVVCICIWYVFFFHLSIFVFVFEFVCSGCWAVPRPRCWDCYEHTVARLAKGEFHISPSLLQLLFRITRIWLKIGSWEKGRRKKPGLILITVRLAVWEGPDCKHLWKCWPMFSLVTLLDFHCVYRFNYDKWDSDKFPFDAF